MSFLAPKVKAPPMPAIPPPAPAPPIKPIQATGSEEARAKEKVRRKKGVSSTILTGPRGLLPEQMPVTAPGLLGGS
tara:strand:- start:6249 stop:6476 length:228 start_codon:yes stop_codon:yes gene_type:complete